MAIYPEHGHNGEDLLRSADEALYQAKAHGKNQARLAGAQPKGSVEYLDISRSRLDNSTREPNKT
jgi:predicted signal transduction protein with EAL and GGDEF domain